MRDVATRDFAIVVAVDAELGIGLAGGLPWRLPGDMAYFKRITSEAPAPLRNAVIMGRKTFESIPSRFRPLPGRLNVVLSRSEGAAVGPSLRQASSLDAALQTLDAERDVHRVFVIGGSDVYRQAIAHPRCTTLYVTRIDGRFGCDAHFPEFEPAFKRVTQSEPQHDTGLDYTFEVYERRA